jgi:hypothetical protein
MNRTSVSSSNIRSIGYDPNTSTLEIEFHNGRIYQYFHVPERLYRELMRAPSLGTFFDNYIKKAGFNYRQIA